MSQIPSAASRRARRSHDRYETCPVCMSRDVDGTHVDRCRELERYRSQSQAAGLEADIPAVTINDLHAHLFSRLSNPLYAAIVVELVIDLGWRPVVGQDPARLWDSATRPGEPSGGDPS